MVMTKEVIQESNEESKQVHETESKVAFDIDAETETLAKLYNQIS